METWELCAREGIRDTLARYAQAADSGRFADLAQLFTPDGVLEIDGGAQVTGRDAIIAFLGRTRDSLAATVARPYIRHHVSSIVITFESPTGADVRSYFLAITDRGPDHWGRYRDRMQRIGGQWLFAHRRVRPDGHAPTSWRATRATPV